MYAPLLQLDVFPAVGSRWKFVGSTGTWKKKKKKKKRKKEKAE